MMQVNLILGAMAIVFAIVSAALLVMVYLKAGFRGPVLVVCLLPGLYSVFGSYIVFSLVSADYGSGSGPVLTPLVINAVLGFVFTALPLLLLAVLKWPVLNNSRDKVEVFQ